MPVAEPRWFICRDRRPEAAVRLYCFPHSGGSPGEYVRWADHLRGVEVCGLQVPGRGARLREEPLSRLAALVETLARFDDFRPPFAFFGHSLGAIVAFEVARALRAAGRTGPEHLFVSACPAPPLQARRRPPHELSDDELLQELATSYGPLPAELRADPELLRLSLPHHRTDSEMLYTYVFEAGELVTVPLTAVGGAADDQVTQAQLDGWRRHAAGSFQVRMLPGGHFYFRDHLEDLLRLIVQGLTEPQAAR